MPQQDNQDHDTAPFDPFAPFKALVEHWSGYPWPMKQQSADFADGYEGGVYGCITQLQWVIAKAEGELAGETLINILRAVENAKGQRSIDGPHHPR